MEQIPVTWEGPYSWDYIENVKTKDLPEVLNTEGVYIFTFEFDGYVAYWPGITEKRPLIKRLQDHPPKFRNGEYNVLDVDSAKKGNRELIWKGWEYAKKHRDEFITNKKSILKAVDKQLCATKIFVAEVSDKRLRERIEAALAIGLYTSGSELIDKGMHLIPKRADEAVIEITNICTTKIDGVPDILLV